MTHSQEVVTNREQEVSSDTVKRFVIPIPESLSTKFVSLSITQKKTVKMSSLVSSLVVGLACVTGAAATAAAVIATSRGHVDVVIKTGCATVCMLTGAGCIGAACVSASPVGARTFAGGLGGSLVAAGFLFTLPQRAW